MEAHNLVRSDGIFEHNFRYQMPAGELQVWAIGVPPGEEWKVLTYGTLDKVFEAIGDRWVSKRIVNEAKVGIFKRINPPYGTEWRQMGEVYISDYKRSGVVE